VFYLSTCGLRSHRVFQVHHQNCDVVNDLTLLLTRRKLSQEVSGDPSLPRSALQSTVEQLFDDESASVDVLLRLILLIFNSLASDCSGLFSRNFVPKAIRRQNEPLVVLCQFEDLDLGHVCNVWASVLGDRLAVAVLGTVLMEVELSVFQPNVANGPGRLQSTLNIACFRVTTFANEHILFIFKLLRQTLLLVSLVSTESSVDVDGVIGAVGFLAEEHALAVATVRHIDLVLVNDSHQGTSADICGLGVASIEGELSNLEPLFFDLIKGFRNRVFNLSFSLSALQVLVHMVVQVALALLGHLPPTMAVKYGHAVCVLEVLELRAAQAIFNRTVALVLDSLNAVEHFARFQCLVCARLRRFGLLLIRRGTEPALVFLGLLFRKNNADTC